MLEPISTTLSVCYLGYSTLGGYARLSNAVSAEALTLVRNATAIVEASEQSMALFGEKAAVLSSLWAIAHECAEQGWDGNAAFPLSRAALVNAESFVRALPDGFRMPECAPEPDGSISLDWIESRNRVCSLSIGMSSRLSYAWLDGSDSGHAVELFDGLSVPRRILSAIESIVGYENSKLRAA